MGHSEHAEPQIPGSVIVENLETYRHAKLSKERIRQTLLATDVKAAIVPVGDSLFGVEPDGVKGETSTSTGLRQMVEVIDGGFKPADVLEHIQHAKALEVKEKRVTFERVVFMVGEEFDDTFQTIEMSPDQAERILEPFKGREVADPVRFFQLLEKTKMREDETLTGDSATLSENTEVVVGKPSKAA